MSLSLLKQYLTDFTTNNSIKEEDNESYEVSSSLQRERNKDFEFFGVDLAKGKTSKLTKQEILNQLSTHSSYVFTGVKISTSPLYRYINPYEVPIDNPDLEKQYNLYDLDYENIYLEFVDTKRINKQIIIEDREKVDNRYNWKYIYIKVDPDILEDISVPYLNTWDVTNKKPIVQRLYPYNTIPYLYKSDNLNFSYSPTKSLYSPLLPFFKYNNKTLRVGFDKTMVVYEYVDTKGFYGRKGQTYLSTVKPINLDYPEGIPSEGSLEKDICTKHLIGEFPSKGILETDIGVYTGFKTIVNKYSKVPYYLYERKDGSTFLSDNIPHKYAKEFIGYYFDPATIEVSTSTINTFLGYKLKVEEASIWIEEFNYIEGLPDEIYYNDGTLINDSLYHI